MKKTIDNKIVFDSTYKLNTTHGLPLEVILGILKARDLVNDWGDYISQALADGHNPRGLETKILSAIGEVYGPTYQKEFAKILPDRIMDVRRSLKAQVLDRDQIGQPNKVDIV